MSVLRFWLTFHVCISILHVPLLLHNTASISMSTIPRQISTRKCTDVLGSQFRSKFAHVCALEIVRFWQTSNVHAENFQQRWKMGVQLVEQYSKGSKPHIQKTFPDKRLEWTVLTESEYYENWNVHALCSHFRNRSGERDFKMQPDKR